MNKNQNNDYSTLKPVSDEDFELMGDMPKEDPIIAERRRKRENEITKKLGEYLLKGYCMLGDSCQDCNCILLRTPEKQLLCVGCNEIDVDKKKDLNEETTKNKKKDHSKKQKSKKKRENQISQCNQLENKLSQCNQLENKLKWAVDELTKSQSPNRINEMCSVIITLTETIKVLKEHEMKSEQN